jgi:hypothetical protein
VSAIVCTDRLVLVDNIVVVISSVTHYNESDKYLGKKRNSNHIPGQAKDAANPGSGP